MEKAEQLKEILSSYWQVREVDWETPFNSQSLPNFSSLRMLRFLASVEDRFQISIEDVDAIRCFGDLLKRVEVGCRTS